MIGSIIACDHAERRAARHLPTDDALQSVVRRPRARIDTGFPGPFPFDDVGKRTPAQQGARRQS